MPTPFVVGVGLTPFKNFSAYLMIFLLCGREVHPPFDGLKNPGNGTSEDGTARTNEFTEIKSVFVDFNGRRQKERTVLENAP
jgi:hypothetical protein